MGSDLPLSIGDLGADDSTPSLSAALGPRSVMLGSDISFGSTSPWPRLGSASADFPMGECCGCVQARRDRRSRRSDESWGITRQGAGKVVGRLSESGYVTVGDSATSRREKSVTLTARGVDYLRAQRAAARAIEDEVRAAVGDTGFSSLHAMLKALDVGDGARLRTYLRRSVEP